MITLFHAPQSRSSRIIWLLEELGQPYQIKPVSIFRSMTGTGEPDPANPHPDKQVPAVLDGDVLLAESVAILLHLIDTYPAAGLAPQPSDPRRGDYLTWMVWYAAAMEPAMFAQFGNELENPMKKRAYDAVVRRIEGALAKGPYMMGEQFTGVDLLVASAIQFGRRAFPESEAIEAYLDRCKARPAGKRAALLDDAVGLQQAA